MNSEDKEKNVEQDMEKDMEKDLECAGLPALWSSRRASIAEETGSRAGSRTGSREASFAVESGGKPPQSISLPPQSKVLPPQFKEYGVQPLDKILEELGLKNHDVVAASTDGLTHKQVGKGRKGRRLTRNIQDKIVVALSAAADKEFSAKELFTYR